MRTALFAAVRSIPHPHFLSRLAARRCCAGIDVRLSACTASTADALSEHRLKMIVRVSTASVDQLERELEAVAAFGDLVKHVIIEADGANWSHDAESFW